jgi:hypothetical protein
MHVTNTFQDISGRYILGQVTACTRQEGGRDHGLLRAPGQHQHPGVRSPFGLRDCLTATLTGRPVFHPYMSRRDTIPMTLF